MTRGLSRFSAAQRALPYSPMLSPRKMGLSPLHAFAFSWGILPLLFLAAAPAWAKDVAVPERPKLALETPRPKAVDPPAAGAIDAAIRRGIDFLVLRQNKNGSWGSARNTKDVNVYAPVPGAHHAFRAAVTSLCISALIESGDARDEVAKSIDRGEAWLFEHLPKLRRAASIAADEDSGQAYAMSVTLYNNWGHAYSIQALARLHRRHADDPARQAKIKALIEEQVKMLGRYECIDGGWTYYDYRDDEEPFSTQKPNGWSFSFVTATALIALAEARPLGVEMPKKTVDRAMDSIRRQRKPDFSYCYGEYLKYVPMYQINRPSGSLGRSQACNLAMRLWHDEETSPAVIEAWLNRLFARNMWLDIGRKRPIPHESWCKVAGYFFYYGHYYAAGCIEQLEPAKRPYFQDHLAHILLPLQEKDGSWWDFPLYDYHQQYGTALAVMSLVRCKR